MEGTADSERRERGAETEELVETAEGLTSSLAGSGPSRTTPQTWQEVRAVRPERAARVASAGPAEWAVPVPLDQARTVVRASTPELAMMETTAVGGWAGRSGSTESKRFKRARITGRTAAHPLATQTRASRGQVRSLAPFLSGRAKVARFYESGALHPRLVRICAGGGMDRSGLHLGDQGHVASLAFGS